MAGYYKAEEVRAAAMGRWADVLGRLGVNTALLENRHGPCPACGGNDRFRWDDKEGAGTWICSQGGGGNIAGDGIGLLEHVTGKDWKECVAMVGDLLLGEAGQHARRDAGVNEGVVVNAPKLRETWVPDFSIEKMRGAVLTQPAVSQEWFMERSPVDVRKITPGEFLEHVFAPGERALVFTNYYSQGDFLWEVGRGGYRLSKDVGVKAVRSKLPVDGGEKGAWFLCNAVDGQWHANPRKSGETSRRIKECVTGWKHLLLECDEEKILKQKAALVRQAQAIMGQPGTEEEKEARAIDALKKCKGVKKDWPEQMMEARAQWDFLPGKWLKESVEVPGLWMRLLAKCGLPIVAIYSSGGYSWHALVRESCSGLADFEARVKSYKQRVPMVGADPAALTPVRLTRLPGVTRNGNLQKLIYLNPAADAGKAVRICETQKIRTL